MSDRVVITGVGAVTPLGCSRETIWKRFQANESALQQVEIAPDLTLWFGRVSSDFDEQSDHHLDFLSEEERAVAMEDRGIAFSMKASHDAIEQSGLDLDSIRKDRIALCVGSSKGQLRSLLQAHLEFRKEGPAGLQANGSRFTSLFRNFPGDLVGQLLACKYGVTGPILNYPAACATGLNSIILGTICAWDFRSDAHHMTAVEPGGSVIEYAIQRTLSKAGWQPGDVQYINAHGTGTELNDQTEAAAIMRIFGQPGPYVSSLKAAIGHLLGASSGAEMALIVIALANGFVPPTLFLDEPDPEFHLNFVPASGAHMDVKRYLKFSYGFGGHIAILAVERD